MWETGYFRKGFPQTWRQSLCWHRGRWRSTRHWAWRLGGRADFSSPPSNSSGRWRAGRSPRRWAAETWGQRSRSRPAKPGCLRTGIWAMATEEDFNLWNRNRMQVHDPAEAQRHRNVCLFSSVMVWCNTILPKVLCKDFRLSTLEPV